MLYKLSTLGPNQDYCKTEHGASGTQIMMYCNLWALVFTISGVAYVDGLDGFEYVMKCTIVSLYKITPGPQQLPYIFFWMCWRAGVLTCDHMLCIW